MYEEITNIYLNSEWWHRYKLSEEQANEYHERLLLQGNILTYVVAGELQGYLEYWRINHEQFGRLVCGKSVYVYDEDILSGNIAYINNMWVSPGGAAFDMLVAMFLAKNQDAEFFTAFRRTKKHQPVLVYNREDFIKWHK